MKLEKAKPLSFLALVVALGSAVLFQNAAFSADKSSVDTDGDTYIDADERYLGTDPHDSTDYPGSGSRGHDSAKRTVESAPEETIPDDKAGNTTLNASGFPTTTCRSGYRAIYTRLCISTTAYNARRFFDAVNYCRARRGRVATYGDLYYLYRSASYLAATYNPYGRWIGNVVGDDAVFHGNRHITSAGDGDINNFEGSGNKNSYRSFWCAHDRE